MSSLTLPSEIAGYKLDSLCVDRFKLDGGAMFGVVPKTLWERSCPSDDKNRIAMGCQSLLLRNRERVVLIDAGLGDKWNDKSRAIYQIEEEKGTLPPLLAALHKLSLTPEDVTDVIVTHLHFDHAGASLGATPRENSIPHSRRPGTGFSQNTWTGREAPPRRTGEASPKKISSP